MDMWAIDVRRRRKRKGILIVNVRDVIVGVGGIETGRRREHWEGLKDRTEGHRNQKSEAKGVGERRTVVNVVGYVRKEQKQKAQGETGPASQKAWQCRC